MTRSRWQAGDPIYDWRGGPQVVRAMFQLIDDHDDDAPDALTTASARWPKPFSEDYLGEVDQ